MNYDSLVGGMWRLVKRRWYLFVAAVVLGAIGAHVLTSSSSYAAEQNIQIGSIEDAGALLDAGTVPEVEVPRLAQQAQLDFEQSELDDTVSASYSANITARTVTVRISGPSEQTVNEALLELNGRFMVIVTEPLIAQIDAGINNASDTVTLLEDRADDTISQLDNDALDDTTKAVLISELSETRSEITDATERRSVLTELRTYVDENFVTFGSSSNTSPARGKLTYAAGMIGGASLAGLAAAGWVLCDRRVRRLLHLERAAPGTPILGFIDRSGAGSQLDSSVRAAARSFVADHQLSRLVVFGIRGSRGLDAIGTAIQTSVDVPVDVSTSSSADSVALDDDATTGYIAVARWGSTTEDQVSTAVGDINRAGNAPVAVILVDIPGRDRDWIAAGVQFAG